jgi:hypothetical protein
VKNIRYLSASLLAVLVLLGAFQAAQITMHSQTGPATTRGISFNTPLPFFHSGHLLKDTGMPTPWPWDLSKDTGMPTPWPW